jgi:hypothetical protein
MQPTAAAVATLAPQVAAQQTMMKQMFELMTEVLGAPIEVPVTKKKFSFSGVEAKNKSLAKYQAAAAQIQSSLSKLKVV